MPTYLSVISFAWTAFVLIWLVSAFWVKRDVRGRGILGAWTQFVFVRIIIIAVAVFVFERVLDGSVHFSAGTPFILRNAIAVPLALGWVGATLTVIGIAFAVWARFHIGRNWSGVPSVKEDHELVTSGPYAFVRHPIYTGIICAAFGTALTGTVFGIVVFVFATLAFLRRIKKEEGIMLGLFPSAYPAYQARTKRLIPFIW